MIVKVNKTRKMMSYSMRKYHGLVIIVVIAAFILGLTGCIQSGESMDYSGRMDDNVVPVINPQSISVPQNDSVIITLAASDPDSSSLSWQAAALPLRGSLSSSGGTLTFVNDNTAITTVRYTAAPGELGQDHFTYYVSDGIGNSATVSVTVTITSGGYVTSPPTAYAATVTLLQDSPASPITLTGTDPEGDTLTWQVITLPSMGILSAESGYMSLEAGISSAVVDYTPDSGENGIDSFTYVVYDGIRYSTEVAVNITITPLNNPPVAGEVAVHCSEDETLPDAALNAADPEGDDLLYFSGMVTTSHGTVTLDSVQGTFTYTPDPDYNGEDSFSYYVTDGFFTSEEALVTITVDPAQDAPVASDMNLVCRVNTPLVFRLNGSDVDASDTLVFEITEYPHDPAVPGFTMGSLTQPDPGDTALCQYTPQSGYNGAVEFTYTVSDGQSMIPVHVSITVTTNATWYVDDDGPLHGDGTSWDSAFRNPQDAVDAAIAGDTICVAGGTYRRRSPGDTSLLTLKDGITVEGGYYYNFLVLGWSQDPENNPSILDGDNLVNHVVAGAGKPESVDASLMTILDGFTIQGGNAGVSGSDNSGGGILMRDASTVINDCTIRSNTARDSGGALYITGESAPEIGNCAFMGNRAYSHGGALFIDEDALAAVADCSFNDNLAADDGVTTTENLGGAICVLGTLSISGSIFGYENFLGDISGGNSADRGGAVYTVSDDVLIAVCSFYDNRALQGGAVYIMESGSVALHDAVLRGNLALGTGSDDGSGRGGALFLNHAGTVSLQNCTLSENEARGAYGAGGALYAWYCTAVIGSGSAFNDNNSGYRGGAFFADHVSGITVNGTVSSGFSGNTASRYGGALYMTECGPVKLESLQIANNSATYGGGAIYAVKNIHLSLTGVTIDNNSVTGSSGNGGGIFLDQYCYAQIISSRLQDNRANASSGCGGAVYSVNGTIVDIKNALIIGNNAHMGGALYNAGSGGQWLNCCTVADNGGDDGSAVYLESGTGYFANSIIYGNDYITDSETGEIITRFFVDGDDGLTVTHSFVQLNWSGDGNISDDESPFSTDYYLRSGSPCIDAGDDAPSEDLLALIVGLTTRNGTLPPADISWDDINGIYTGELDMGFHR